VKTSDLEMLVSVSEREMQMTDEEYKTICSQETEEIEIDMAFNPYTYYILLLSVVAIVLGLVIAFT